MKGEYVEERKNHANNSSTPSNIYKLHQTQNFQHHHQQPPPPPSSTANDGATIEVVRRPRGRPPGSKNKSKPAPHFIITARDDHVEKPIMSPYILEILTGVDVIDSVYRFCSKQNTGLCILNGSGTVTNVTLKQPTINNVITLHGIFNILSISATIVTQSISRVVPNGFSISLAGPQGQVVGGPVIGPLLSAGPVYLIAASFNNPVYHKFTAEEEEEEGGGQSQQVAVSGGGDSGHPPESTVHEYCYSSNQLPSGVIWAPTARQPPPY
ncbi:AT-hook motif nuclear-localized protein 17-like [Lycium barbarum]|uniref:AT-hook motif nuclear-localized protein 17-like n=1 Tax=Lycium barbarum TaxID=112863 RepID=UPI00293EBC0A|nr:AT-hook motif nuclear-localized protein 17-like [Lycium barbarum]